MTLSPAIIGATTSENLEGTTRVVDVDFLPFFSFFPFFLSSLFAPTAVAYTDFSLFLHPFHPLSIHPEASPLR